MTPSAVTKESLDATVGKPPAEIALYEAGVDLRLCAEKLREELDAEETKFFAHQGEVVEVRNVIAWSVRQRAREDAQKLLGAYPSEKHELTGAAGAPLSVTVQFVGVDKK